MDYVPGRSVKECWNDLNAEAREKVTTDTARMIEEMQSVPFNNLPPGPIGGQTPFTGPWFSDHGAGPFETFQELENWFTHTLDVCLRFNQAPGDTPRFKFGDFVLTHQDIAPRSLILHQDDRLWLIDG